MKIEIEIDTLKDSPEKVERVLDSLRSVEIEKTPEIEKTSIYWKPKNGDLNQIIRELKNDVKRANKTKGKKRSRLYTVEFKKRFVKFHRMFKLANPNKTNKEIEKMIGVSSTTFQLWLKGKKLGKVGKKPSKKKVEKKSEGLRKWKRLPENEVKERNIKIIDYCNKNPYDSWEEISEKFGLTPSRIYGIAKTGGVKIMKRSWEKMLDKKTLKYSPEPKTIEPKKKDKNLAEMILKFEHSKKPQEDTIKAINECISKGVLSFKDDANKFGFDRRMLPTSDWFSFITEVAKKVNIMLGIDVSLNPAMTGITFKK